MSTLSWPFLGPGLVSLLTTLASESSIIFLPLFAQELGARELQIGMIGGTHAFAYFIASWIFGRQSDIRGRLLFIRIGLGLATLCLAAQLVANDLAILLLVRALVGISLGILAPAIMAYNFEVGASTGRFASFGSLGALVGVSIAAFVHKYDTLFLLSAASCGLAFAASLSLKEKETRYRTRPVTLQVFRRNLWIYLPVFFRHLGANMVWVIYPLLLTTLGASKTWIALLAGINTGCQVVFQVLVEKLKGGRLFLLGLFLSALVFIGYSQATYYLQAIPIQVVLAVSWSCLYVGALLLLLNRNDEKATTTGLLYSTLSISGTVGPFLGGFIAQVLGYQPLMYLAAGLCLSGLGIAAAKAR